MQLLIAQTTNYEFAMLTINIESIKAMRLHQWLKNILIFVPAFTSHKFNTECIEDATLAFLAFSLLASSVYVVNDMRDVESDRVHPRKRNRPFASGSLSHQQGIRLAAALILSSLLLGIYNGPKFFGVLICYFIIATAYTMILKKKLIIDICTLAGLYTMRLVAGGYATNIPLSVWLLAFSIFFFLSLAAVKRQAELVDNIQSGQIELIGRGYQIDDLPIISSMALSAGYLSVLILALYINSPEVVTLYKRPFAIWGVCLVILYWISRMVMAAHRGIINDDPIIYSLKDRISYFCLGIIMVFLFAGVI
jgi:4-hydroxybenzoate polyprenyltransferase